MISDKIIKNLEEKAKQIRKDIMVQLVGAGGGHSGPSLSMVELCVALYFHHAKLDPKNPEWEERDRIVLGKAHAAETIYSCLARLGYFSPDLLPTYKHFGSMLQGHADAWSTVGLEYSGGSLGQGLSFALGLALAARAKATYDVARQEGVPNYKIYCICGDGELHEGEIWEAAMAAAHYKCSNLINIVDANQFSVGVSIDKGMDLEPLVEKWQAFGWWATEIDGHNFRQILETLQLADTITGKPKCIIARTVKGKGIPFYEKSHAHMIPVTEQDYERLIDTIY
jgi:transketolase